MTGIVKFYNETKGFGFITNNQDHEDIFVHVTALNGIVLQQGDNVTYIEQEAKKGMVAVDVKLIS